MTTLLLTIVLCLTLFLLWLRYKSNEKLNKKPVDEKVIIEKPKDIRQFKFLNRASPKALADKYQTRQGHKIKAKNRARNKIAAESRRRNRA